MSETNERMKEYLADNPKMAGALFTLLMLLAQVGNVAAGPGGAHVGP